MLQSRLMVQITQEPDKYLCNSIEAKASRVIICKFPVKLPFPIYSELQRASDDVGPTFNGQPQCAHPTSHCRMVCWRWSPVQTTASSQTGVCTDHPQITRAVIDLGKSERAVGCTFAAISRMRSLQDCLIQPMTFDRLQSKSAISRTPV